MLLGNSDDIVLYLIDQLGWDLPPAVPRLPDDAPVPSKRTRGSLKRKDSSGPRLTAPPARVGGRQVYIVLLHVKFTDKIAVTFGSLKEQKAKWADLVVLRAGEVNKIEFAG